MEMNIHDDTQIVEIWLTNAEKTDPVLQDELKGIYAEYKAKKYMVAVFQSGQGDLYENTRDLLLFNRRRAAERAVQARKAALGIVLAMLAVLLAVLICIVAPFFALSAALLVSGGYVLAPAFGAAPVFLPGGVTLFGTGLLLLSLGLLCSVFTGYLCYWIGLLFKKIFSSGKRKKAVKGAAV